MTGDWHSRSRWIAEREEKTQRLDPNDADDRALLIAAAHPELNTDAETALVDGHEFTRG